MTERTIQSMLAATGLTEAELADLLEGGSLPADREAALRSALARHPEVASFFSGIRADRAAMRVLNSSIHAPANLLDAVEIRLEQEALRSLTEPATPAAAVPAAVPATRIERRNPILVALESVWARRLVAAAGLLLAIGLGIWGTIVGIRNWPAPGPGGSGGSLGTGPIAIKDAAPAVPEGAGVSPDGGAALVSAEPDAPMFTALAMTSPVEGPGIAADGTVYSEDQLLDLAGAGRLAIVISGRDGSIADRLDRLDREGSATRVSSISSDSLALTMPPLAAAMARESDIPRSEWAASLRDPWMEQRHNITAAGTRRIVSIASATDSASLRSVLAACGVVGELSHMPGRTVRIMVLDEPVDQAPATDAASVLWWSAAPSKWVRTTTVPVIIEE